MLIKQEIAKLEKEAPQMLKDGLQKRIDEYDPTKIVLEASTELLEQVRSSIYEQVSQRINKEINAAVGINNNKKLSANIIIPKSKEIVHEKFAEIRTLVEGDVPVLLVGPTGSGKGFTANQVADSLGLAFGKVDGGVSDKFEITGYNDANGKYVESEFHRIFTKGGVFCIDEMDASDPLALKVVNDAMANRKMAFPCGIKDANSDFRSISTANTYGTGGDSVYVGTNQLDASSLDRFYQIWFDYSKQVEESLCPDKKLLEFLWATRQAAMDNKVQLIICTRGIKNLNHSINNLGLTFEQAINGLVLRNQSIDTTNHLLERMKKNGSDIEKNKYFRTLRAINQNRIKAVGKENV